MEEKYCQSCAMPMGATDEMYGTEQDGTKSADYCKYCYENGAFTFQGTMQEMIELCLPPHGAKQPRHDRAAGARDHDRLPAHAQALAARVNRRRCLSSGLDRVARKTLWRRMRRWGRRSWIPIALRPAASTACCATGTCAQNPAPVAAGKAKGSRNTARAAVSKPVRLRRVMRTAMNARHFPAARLPRWTAATVCAMA